MSRSWNSPLVPPGNIVQRRKLAHPERVAWRRRGDSQACASIPPQSVLLSRRAAQGARFGRMTLLFRCFALAVLALFAASAAQAHPHVWVTMKSELVYG